MNNVSNCDWCNTSFGKKNKKHRFCSTPCRKKWHKKTNGQPLLPSFISDKVKLKNRVMGRTLERQPIRVNPNRINALKSPRIAEIQTKINWLESQKTNYASSNGLTYGVAGAAASRFVSKDVKFNLIVGFAAYLYGKSTDENKFATIQLQNANIQRQIDELQTEIVKEEDRIKNLPTPPSTDHDDFKIISAKRIEELEHSKYELDGQWKYFLEYMPTSFNGIIYGLPKAGTTHLSIQFAQYLEMKFGNVMYISGEEGVEEPFNEKLKRYNSSFAVAYDVKGSYGIIKAIEKTKPKFVFVDSLNRLGLDVNDIIKFKSTFPNTVFMYVLQSTKDGKFKGSQSIEHEVTSTIRVVNGVAHQKGRTVQEQTELAVFK